MDNVKKVKIQMKMSGKNVKDISRRKNLICCGNNFREKPKKVEVLKSELFTSIVSDSKTKQ